MPGFKDFRSEAWRTGRKSLEDKQGRKDADVKIQYVFYLSWEQGKE